MSIQTSVPEAFPAGQNRRALLIVFVGLVVHGVLVATVGLPRDWGQDFFLYYMGARVNLTGESPYKAGAIRYDQPAFHNAAVAHFKWRGIENPGRSEEPPLAVTYPPQAYLLFLPVSRLPWNGALAVWTVFLTVLAVGCGSLAWTFEPGVRRSPIVGAWLAVACLLNPLSFLVFSLGQATFVVCGGIALGQWAFSRGWHWLGVLSWSLAATKPHLAIPFVGFLLAAGHWRRFRDVCMAILVLNVLGGIVLSGNPLMALDFVKKAGHFANHAANSVRSDTIVSWNHVVFVLGGPLIDLTAKTILVGNAVWAGLLLARAAPGRAWRVWSLPFLLATAAVGSILCAQAHNYDIILFILIVPYLLWLWDRRYMFDVAILAVVLVMASVPRSVAVFLTHRAGFSQGLSEVMLSYKAFATVALAMYLLARGQPVPGVPESESDQDRTQGEASVRFGTTEVST